MLNFLFKKRNIKNPVIVRIPPSPTGNLHVGTARTALFNFIFACQNKGKIILRFEDTDKERSSKKYEKNIIDGLDWLGITYDETYRQSERTKIYKKYLEKLIEEGKAYISKETIDPSKDEKDQRNEVIRFKNPNKKITFTDEVRGEISFDTTELGDFVIAKSLEEPLYHLAVVVDDFDMGITHVIRGDDGISNTPRQILIQEAVGAPRPTYAHLPLILGPDKSKLSKRHGATAITEYRNRGYLSEAMVNFLLLLGWNPGNDTEILDHNTSCQIFDLKKIQKGGAVFNEEKLNWFNREYIKKMDPEELSSIIAEKLNDLNVTGETLQKIENLIIERINTFSDIDELKSLGELDYFGNPPQYKKEQLLWKDSKDLNEVLSHLGAVEKMIEKVDEENFNPDKIKEGIWDYATKEGRGNVLWPFRFALSGKDKSPDPFELSYILGKDEVLKRLSDAKKIIQQN